MYPDHNWLSWKFQEGAPPGYWDIHKNVEQAIKWAEAQLHIQDLDGKKISSKFKYNISDWYAVNIDQMFDLNLGSLVTKNKGKILISNIPRKFQLKIIRVTFSLEKSLS